VAAEIYLMLAGSIVGYSAYTYALKYLPTATVSLYAYANPVIAIVLGNMLLGEPLGPRVVAASGLVLAGSALVQWRGGAKRAEAGPPSSPRNVTDRSMRTTAASRRSLPG
jgi:drug/metabolite transporter (DMT)-like permease